MTNKKSKKTDKRQIPLRPRGEVISSPERPSKTLFDAVLKAEKDDSPVIADPTLPYPTIPYYTLGDTTTHYPANSKKTVPVSPTKNFTKVSNSLVKSAIPEGLFRGQSKHTYDVLYQATRGAINPKREVQLAKSELVRLTGLEIKTIQRHLSYLRSVGLIMVDPKIGDHKGASYEVKIPEETTLPYPTLPESSVVEAGVVSTPHPSVECTTLGYGNPIENKGLTETPNTFFKDSTKHDDEAFADLNGKLSNAVEKLTGKKPSLGESEKWGMLAELLILELEIAARHAGAISSVPAFLTEHLRRRLFAARRNEQQGSSASKTSKTKPDVVGKAEAETFEIKPLDEHGRETALAELEEFANEDFLADFAKWYTPEDWQWLTEQLKKK